MNLSVPYLGELILLRWMLSPHLLPFHSTSHSVPRERTPAAKGSKKQKIKFWISMTQTGYYGGIIIAAWSSVTSDLGLACFCVILSPKNVLSTLPHFKITSPIHQCYLYFHSSFLFFFNIWIKHKVFHLFSIVDITSVVQSSWPD